MFQSLVMSSSSSFQVSIEIVGANHSMWLLREGVSLSAPPSFYSSRRGHSLTDRKECNFPRPQPKQELSEGATSELGRRARPSEGRPLWSCKQDAPPRNALAAATDRNERTKAKPPSLALISSHRGGAGQLRLDTLSHIESTAELA